MQRSSNVYKCWSKNKEYVLRTTDINSCAIFPLILLLHKDLCDSTQAVKQKINSFTHVFQKSWSKAQPFRSFFNSSRKLNRGKSNITSLFEESNRTESIKELNECRMKFYGNVIIINLTKNFNNSYRMPILNIVIAKAITN